MNNDSILHSFSCKRAPPSITDHYIIECDSLYETKRIPARKRTALEELASLNFFSDAADWDSLRGLAGVDWDEEFESQFPEQMLDMLGQVCYSKATEKLPRKKKKNGPKSKSRIPPDRKNLVTSSLISTQLQERKLSC